MINSKEELPEKWAIKRNLPHGQNKIVTDWINNKFNVGFGDQLIDSYYLLTNASYDWSDTLKTGYKLITFEEFKKYVLNIQEEQFPKDDFGVVVENSNGAEILSYLSTKGFNTALMTGTSKSGYYGIKKGNDFIGCYESGYFSKTYTLQQLKQLDNNNMETTKKIAYYVVKTDILWGRNGSYWGKDSKIYATNTDSLLYFKSLGLTEKPDILEPVYEKQEKVINMGSFNLTVKPEGIFHSSEDITTFVKGISANLGKFISNKKYGKLGKEYDFTVKDVIISKTGCQNSETKLSQWLAVWEEYVKIKQ